MAASAASIVRDRMIWHKNNVCSVGGGYEGQEGGEGLETKDFHGR
jgi:hypothetical protein